MVSQDLFGYDDHRHAYNVQLKEHNEKGLQEEEKGRRKGEEEGGGGGE